MSVEATTSTIDVLDNVVDMGENQKDSPSNISTFAQNPDSEIEETIKNMTSTSRSYSSTLDASRSHLRLKMSGGSAKPGLGLHGGRSPMKIPSLLQKLPCHGKPAENPSTISATGTSAASAVTLSALSVIERGAETQEIGDGNLASSVPMVNLDDIDLDNITIGDLKGLQAADGDILRAKHLNKLSRKEREHVLQDIHGVADAMEETANIPFVNDSLRELQAEIDRQLVFRKEKEMDESKNHQHQRESFSSTNTSGSQGDATPKLPALEEQLGKLQEKLDQLKRRRSNLDNSINGGSDFSSLKQVSAKNHPAFGKLGDIAGFGSFNKDKTTTRPSSVPSSCFGGSSSFFSPTTAMAKSSLAPKSVSDTNEAQQDAAILKSKDAIAYEQALAQCRGRRRERNNSLFRPNLMDDEDDDLDEGLYIDVEQREFRLSFLRAERYDIEKAATRVIDYFEEKRRLFGVDNLTTKIKLKDLDAESKDCLESGQMQLLPERDRAGRAVIVATQKLSDRKRRQDTNSTLRAFWILCAIALEDTEIEKNGVVFVKYDIGSSREEGDDGFHRGICDWGNVLRALPLRVASIHWCVGSHALKQAANLSALMLGGSNFVRVRCHAGTDMEVQYDLMTFGIPTGLFPVSMNGKIDLSRHLDFLQQRKKMEASTLLNKALALVETPMLDDCIALDVIDDEQEPQIGARTSTATGSDRFSSTSVVTSENGFNKTGSTFQVRNQTHYQQEHEYQKHQEINRAAADFGFNNTGNNNNNNMNKIGSSPFNDSFNFLGNRDPVQVQSSMQQQYQQRRQQHLNGFQQQLGMNMNMNMNMGMGMGIVQQFSQSQQMQRQQQQQQQQHQNTGITAESKSGISYSMEPVLVPGELDILLGRGRGAQNHKGNIHYRQVVETFRSRYEQIPQKGAKTQLIREVVAVIYDNGGRFLKQDGFGRWIPVDPEVARDKVSHSFRNQKRLSTGASGSDSPQSKKRPRDETE